MSQNADAATIPTPRRQRALSFVRYFVLYLASVMLAFSTAVFFIDRLFVHRRRGWQLHAFWSAATHDWVLHAIYSVLVALAFANARTSNRRVHDMKLTAGPRRE